MITPDARAADATTRRTGLRHEASIVIPLLSQVDEWLEVSVRSALAQSAPTEVIVVTSRSTPASNLKILERLQEHHDALAVLPEEKPGSFPGAINTGFRQARCDRVGLLLSDDWLDKAAVEQCLQYFADIVSTGNIVYFPDGRINEAACRSISMAHFLARPTLEAKACYLRHFFLFRREFALAAGGLDETIGNYPGIDDFDFIWTLLEHGATVGIIEKRLYHYRDHDGERLTLADAELATRNLEKILRKHLVVGEEAKQIVDNHSRWYGRPIYKVMGLG